MKNTLLIKLRFFYILIFAILVFSHCRKDLGIPTVDEPPNCTYSDGRDCSLGPPGNGIVVNPSTVTLIIDMTGNTRAVVAADPFSAMIYNGTTLIARTPFGISLNSTLVGNTVFESVDASGQPSGLPMNFPSASTYTLYITVGGQYALKFINMSITTKLTLSYVTADFTDTVPVFPSVAGSPVTLTATGVPIGTKASCIWLVLGIYTALTAPDPSTIKLFSGPPAKTLSRSPHALGSSVSNANTFTGGGTMVADAHWGLLAGTYDLSCWADSDANGLYNAGDYYKFEPGVVVSNGTPGTSVTLDILAYTADIYENGAGDNSAVAVTTASLGTNGVKQAHTIHVGTDVDYIRFNVDPTQTGMYYDVEVSDVKGGLDPVLTLYMPDGTTVVSPSTPPVAPTNPVNANGVNQREVINIVRLSTSGDYFIKVNANGSSSTGSYSVAVRPSSERYIIETTATANATTADTVVTVYSSDGLTKMAKDVTTGYGCIDDAAAGTPNDGSDDNSGVSAPGKTSKLDCNLIPGTYYIKVTGNSGTSKGAYGISASLPAVENTSTTRCANTTRNPGDGSTLVSPVEAPVSAADTNDYNQDDNSILTARTLKAGCYYQQASNLHNPVPSTIDTDWYKLTVASHASTYIIQTGATANAASADTRAALFSSDGTTKISTCYDDSEAFPTVTFQTATSQVSEDSGAVSVPVILSASTKQVTTIPYTVGGTASNSGGGIDHTLSDGQITIQAGERIGYINFNIVNDTDGAEPLIESIIITLGAPTNATLGATTIHTMSLMDNDQGTCASNPTVNFSVNKSVVQESPATATTPVNVKIVIQQCSQSTVTIPYTISGTATILPTANNDHTLQDANAVIASGSVSAPTTVNISFNIVNDSIIEPDETIIITMGVITNGTAGATSVHTVTIKDDDTTSNFNDINDGDDQGSAGKFGATNFSRLYCFLPSGTYYLRTISEPTGNELKSYSVSIRDAIAEPSSCATTGASAAAICSAADPGNGGSADCAEALEMDDYSTAQILDISCAKRQYRNFDNIMGSPSYDIDWVKILIP